MVTLFTETSISIYLEPVEDAANGGSDVTGYIVQIDDGLGGDYLTVHDSLEQSLILTQLESGRLYNIRYAARNILYDQDNMYECDQLQFSDPVQQLTAVEPSVPRDLRHASEFRYRDALVFEWEAPLSTGGSKLELYYLEVTNALTLESTTLEVTIQAAQLKIDNLVPATEYEVRIRTSNLVGFSDWSESVKATTGIRPSRPGILSFDATTRTTLSLSWTQLVGADTGGSDESPLSINYYHLYVDDGLGGEFRLHDSISGSESSFTVENLKVNLQYRLHMRAENSIGLVSATSTEQTMQVGSLPTAPGAPRLVD